MEVAVIGGGIVGLFTAYYLQREGASVTLYEPREPGSDSIHAAGILEPENFYRINNLSYLRRAWRYWRNGSSHLDSIDHRFVRRYLTSMGRSPTADGWVRLRALAEESTRAYTALAAEKNDFELTMGGLEEVYESRRAFEGAVHDNERKVPKVKFEVRERKGIAGVIYFPNMGWLHTELFVQRLLLEIHGVTICPELVRTVTPEGLVGGKAEPRKFDSVLVCTGVAARQFGVPLTAVKGYGWHAVSREKTTIARIYADRGIASVPLAPTVGQSSLAETHLKVTGGWDFDLARDAPRASEVLRIATRVCAIERVLDARSGQRPCAPDGLPVLGRVDNVTFVAGGFRLGWSYAPGMAREGAYLALGKATNDRFLSRYCPKRLPAVTSLN